MTTNHRLRCLPSPAGSIFECDECSRLLTLDSSGTLTVIDRGDPFAVHHGGSDGLQLDTPSVAE